MNVNCTRVCSIKLYGKKKKKRNNLVMVALMNKDSLRNGPRFFTEYVSWSCWKTLRWFFETLKLGTCLPHPLSFTPMIMDLQGSWFIIIISSHACTLFCFFPTHNGKANVIIFV